jgi:hypothetical protein
MKISDYWLLITDYCIFIGGYSFMRQTNLGKLAAMAALLLLLVVVMVGPAAAQEPEGDVGIQAADFVDFLWNPADTAVSRGDGTVITKLDVQGAQQISGLTLAIGYDASIISPVKVTEGDLLPGTRGVDYFMTVRTGGGALECGGDSSFTVEIVYFDPTDTINGSGSLIEILWRSDPDAAVGDVGTICLDGTDSLAVDNGGFPALTPVPDVLGSIEIEPASIFTFQIGLEGGKNSGLPVVAVPNNIFTQVIINDIFPCDGGGVNALGFCAFNNATASPPYTVEVSRIGYLDAEAEFEDPHDSTSIWLWAGDLNGDNVINILDIQLMASLLGSTVGPSTLSQAADYSGPAAPGVAPAPDGVINIIDLVLMAKNFGASGPTDSLPPGGGTFPF